MNALFHSLVTLLATAIDHQLRQYVEFLKEENALLRARLPAESRTRPEERKRPFALGLPLGRAIESLITIVTAATFYRWQREASSFHGRQSEKRTKSLDSTQPSLLAGQVKIML